MRVALRRWFLIAVLLTVVPPSTVTAKSYSAERFDSIIRVLANGTLEVTETVVFRFEEGTFKEVFRELPLRRTDGIEVVSATMQGQPLPFGREVGTVEVQRRENRVRVVWRFATVEGVTREFVLKYLVRGVVAQENAADVLSWRATPGEHRYEIAASTIHYELPVPPVEAPSVRTRKTDPPRVTVNGSVVRIDTSAIRRNGWIDTTLRFSRGTVIVAAPAWQQHADRVAAQSGGWMIGAAVVAIAGLILLIAWRQSYDAPRREFDAVASDSSRPTLPGPEPPAVAGALAADGRAAIEHAMAVLFAMADRGQVEITELARGVLGQRDFQVTWRRGPDPALTEYERAVLETIFKNDTGSGNAVKLSQARSRLSMHLRNFSRAMGRELAVNGFLDESRKMIRDRYTKAAVWLLVLGLAAFVPAILLNEQHGAWPLLIPATILFLALCSVLFAATVTPLSNQGLRAARRWREYRDHLRAVARGKHPSNATPASTVLPFAVALGVAAAWGKYLNHHAHAVPAWFHRLHGTDDRAAFPAFITAGGAGAHGGGVHGGGGIAGGGASGAR